MNDMCPLLTSFNSFAFHGRVSGITHQRERGGERGERRPTTINERSGEERRQLSHSFYLSCSSLVVLVFSGEI